MKRTLIAERDGTKVYEVATDDGKVIGHDFVGPTTPEQTNQTEIETKAREALAANKTFVAIANPSAAQNAAQVKALTRQVNGIIRLLLNELGATD